ncbi:MAG TPA: MFS transporter [Paenalcaligenes hominis]|uniref:Multidrug transporter MdfA n=1 Tax=Paenalcaligenes hominis TaxID=643674 RepID=A0A9D2VFC9_9BURK|nr:MFS transporter [Paenalcaligenes hominis]
MQIYQSLTFRALLFPLAFALFEAAVYIGNDLVQPAMLAVTQEFGVGAEWTPTSMSAYMLGGALLAVFWGPISDQLGRRRVFLSGALFFVVGCVAIIFTQTIEQFLLWRFLQGTALTLITAVGLAAIQEAYSEGHAVRVTAMIANITLLAPLLGPILGALLIEHVSWHWGFIGIAALAGLAWLGLWRYMPETLTAQERTPKNIKQVIIDYRSVLSCRRFIIFAMSGPLLALPVMLWIALSPVFLVQDLGLSNIDYALSQIPVLGGLILGNVVVARWVERMPLGKTVLIGFPFVLCGWLSLLMGIVFSHHLAFALIFGMSLIAFGEGLSFAVMYRFALMSSPVSKGTVAAAIATLGMVFYAVFIEVTRHLYQAWGLSALVFMTALSLVIFIRYSLPLVKQLMQERARN